MQSLQADQSLYNRKGVCYFVHVIGRFQVIRILVFLFVTANIIKISLIPAKINENVSNQPQNVKNAVVVGV